jgi:hypothetical protein
MYGADVIASAIKFSVPTVANGYACVGHKSFQAEPIMELARSISLARLAEVAEGGCTGRRRKNGAIDLLLAGAHMSSGYKDFKAGGSLR